MGTVAVRWLTRRAGSCCLVLALGSGSVTGQSRTSNPTATGGVSGVILLPPSGRTAQPGSVTATQSTTNTGGANSVDLINSSVNVQGPYQGSVPTGINTGTVLPLTLEYALTIGLRYNLGAISQNQAVQQAQGQRLVARSALLPTVSTTISEFVQQINLRTLGVQTEALPSVVGPFNYFDARAARLNQSVIDFVRLGNLRSATESVTSARESARDARDLVVLAIAGGYLQLTAIQARIEAASAQVTTSQAIYQQAADRLRLGLNARIDVTRSQVQLQTDQQRLRSLQADRDRAALNLGRLIGLPLGQQFSIAEDFPYRPLTALAIEDTLTRAYEGRADFKAAQASVRAAEAAEKAARAERLPSLVLNADYGAAGLRPTGQAHGTFTVEGTLTIPLYQGGRVRGEIEQARAAVRLRQAELEEVRGRIDQDVRRAFIDLNAAADQVTVAQSNVTLARDELKQARDRFLAGISDTVEVVQAQQGVVQANNDYISAVFEHNLGKVSLARAVGGAEQSVRQLLRRP